MSTTDEAVRYDGEDDSLLPDRLQKILVLLAPSAAQRMRDWLTNYAITEIEEQLDYILGGDSRDLPDHLRPPVNPTHVVQVEAPDEDELWDGAEQAVDRIAKMYERLSQAGMSEQTAVAIIADEINGIRMSGKVASGFANVPVAGARAVMVQRGDGQFVPGVTGMANEDLPPPSAGWPPRPIE
jgi:hypothetical protein